MFFRGTDEAGNVSEVSSLTVGNIDKVAPVAPVAVADVTKVTNGNVSVSAVFSADSIVKEYSLDGETWTAYTNSIVFEENGTVFFRGFDEAGNVSEISSFTVGNIDKVAPEAPVASADINWITNRDITVTAVFSDDSVRKQYSIDGWTWLDYSDPIVFEENGSVLFLAQDLAGNFSYASYVVGNIDKVAPVAPVAAADITKVTNGDVNVSAVFSADIAVKEYSLDGQVWKAYTKSIKFEENGTVFFRGMDAAGNVSAVTSYTVSNIDKSEPFKNKRRFFVGYFDGSGKAMLATANNGEINVYADGERWGGMTWDLAGVGDFNGDGADDILRIHTSGLIIGEISNAAGSFYPVVLNFKSEGWDIIGIGDFNGNGTDDVLIANPTAASETIGLFGYWESGTDWTLINGYSNEWDMIAVGDFNADGKCDMLWRNSFTGVTGETFNSYCTWIVDPAVGEPESRMVSVANPDEWNFLCTGDFNADGASDIAMINGAGVVGIWGIENGYLSSWSILSAVDTSTWTLAGVGDFNGDGTDDIVWCNEDTGLAGYWQINNKELADWKTLATIS